MTALAVAFCILALATASVYAAPTFQGIGSNNRPMRLVLYEEPCSPEVLLWLKPQLHDLFKRATLTWGDRDWKSCWLQWEGKVYSIDEEGSAFQPIPANLFFEPGVSLDRDKSE